ncbi:MAG: acetate--CoA ligase family protein [Proteobacteria bacterium]|nr:acetate--CoA ligase family protein [Pseudomonadota bacterium]
MNFEEHAAKPLLAAAGIATPPGEVATSADEAEAIARRIGACVVKAQVPTGKRGKAGGIRLAATPEEAAAAARDILGMEIGGHRVARVLVEAQVPIAAEYYAAVLNDPESKGPLLLFSAMGGMEVEELAATRPDALLRLPIDIRRGPARADVERGLAGLGLDGAAAAAVTEVLEKLYRAYRDNDAELLEINPLARAEDGGLVALDCKFVLDDSALPRQAELAANGTPEVLTDLEAEARAIGLRFIELDGSVGVLANGAGLTMTTIDAVRHYGGEPANFLEIGGDAYVKATPALKLVLANPKVKSLLINFCGAVARTDVMTGGVLDAWDELKPSLPVFFSIHGTGEEEAVAMLRARLGLEPFDLMDDAVKAAVEAAR